MAVVVVLVPQLQEETLAQRRAAFKSPPGSAARSPKERFQDACKSRIRAQKDELVRKFRVSRMADTLVQLRELVQEAMEDERAEYEEELGDEWYNPEFWEQGAYACAFMYLYISLCMSMCA